MQGKDFNHCATALGPEVIIFFFSKTCLTFCILLFSLQTFFFKDLFLLFFYWKGGYTERRDREEDLPSDDSLPK